MSARLRRRARGAATVEVLVIVGVVLLLGVVAVAALGRSSSEHAGREAACIQSFSCGSGADGAGSKDVSSLAGRQSAGAPTGDKGAWASAKDVAKGFFVDGLWGTVAGIGSALMNPIDTIAGVGNAIAHPIATAGAIKDAAVSAWNENPERLLGAGAFELVTLPIAATKGAKVAKVARRVDAVADGADAVADARRAKSAGVADCKTCTSEARMAKLTPEQAQGAFEHAFNKVNGRPPSDAEIRAAQTGGIDPKVKRQMLDNLAAPTARAEEVARAAEAVRAAEAAGTRLSDGAKTASREQLERALRDPSYASELGRKDGLDARRLQRDAAIRLSREDAPGLTSGTPLTREQLESQAKMLGHSVERQNGYRVDARPPGDIARAGGFTPNPSKPPQTLWEHTAQGSPGGGNVVSMSTVEGNKTTLAGTDFPGRKYLEQSDEDIVAYGQAGDLSKLRPTREVRYEYAIENVDAVRLKDASYAAEAEAVTSKIPNENIARYRQVIVTQRPYKDTKGYVVWTKPEVILGDWKPFPGR